MKFHSPALLYILCAGYSDGHVPSMTDDDTLDVFVLKAPVWEFVTGDLLGHFVSVGMV